MSETPDDSAPAPQRRPARGPRRSPVRRAPRGKLPAANAPVPPPPTGLPTTAELNRRRIAELRGALEAELAELRRRLPALLDELSRSVEAQLQDLQDAASQRVDSTTAFDAPDAINLGADIEKAARRLLEFRGEPSPSPEELAKLLARLRKSTRRLRGA